MNLDLSQFFGAFFEEAEELLVDMERLLLNLDVANPSSVARTPSRVVLRPSVSRT